MREKMITATAKRQEPEQRPSRGIVLSVNTTKQVANGVRELFIAGGPDVIKWSAVRSKLGWKDVNGVSIAGILARSSIPFIQIALAGEPEVLQIKDAVSTLPELLRTYGNDAVKAKITETENANFSKTPLE